MSASTEDDKLLAAHRLVSHLSGAPVWTSAEAPRMPLHPENLTALEIKAEVERYQAEITRFKNAMKTTEKRTAHTLRDENLTGIRAESLKRELKENIELIQKGIDVLEKRKGMFRRKLLVAKLKQPLICQRMREAEEVVEKARQLNDEISVQVDKLKNTLSEMESLKTKYNAFYNEFLKTNLDPNKRFPLFNVEVPQIVQQTLNQLCIERLS